MGPLGDTGPCTWPACVCTLAQRMEGGHARRSRFMHGWCLENPFHIIKSYIERVMSASAMLSQAAHQATRVPDTQLCSLQGLVLLSLLQALHLCRSDSLPCGATSHRQGPCLELSLRDEGVHSPLLQGLLLTLSTPIAHISIAVTATSL